MKGKVILAGIISLMIIGNLAAGCGDSYDKTVQIVRNSTLAMNPNVPVGKAFDQFFANGKWRSFTSTENETIVEFSGECTWFNAPAKMLVQFNIIDGESFMLQYVDINGVAFDFMDSASVIEKVLSEYRP